MASAKLDAALLNKLDRMALAMREMARAQRGGARRSRVRGTSVEFADYRTYAPGDDFRRIDWNAFGRLGRLYIKLFLEEKEAVASIFLDSSASMGTITPEKAALAQGLCAALGYMALNRQDRVCPYRMEGDSARRMQSVMGKGMFPAVCNFFESAAFEGKTLLGQALSRVQPQPGGLCILVSDLFSGDDWMGAVKKLRYQKQDVAVIHLLDKTEVDPPYQGRLRLIDSETGAYRDAELDAFAHDAYRRALADFRRKARAACHQAGAIWIELDTSLPLEGALFGPVAQSGLLE